MPRLPCACPMEGGQRIARWFRPIKRRVVSERGLSLPERKGGDFWTNVRRLVSSCRQRLFSSRPVTGVCSDLVTGIWSHPTTGLLERVVGSHLAGSDRIATLVRSHPDAGADLASSRWRFFCSRLVADAGLVWSDLDKSAGLVSSWFARLGQTAQGGKVHFSFWEFVCACVWGPVFK